MPLVPVPRGNSTNVSPLETLIRLLQTVDGEAAGGEPQQQQEAEPAQESHSESR